MEKEQNNIRSYDPMNTSMIGNLAQNLPTDKDSPTREFRDKINKSKELDKIYEFKDTVKKKLCNNSNKEELSYYEHSKDKHIITDINENNDMKDFIVKFNGLSENSVAGDYVTKKLAVKMIANVTDPDFRNTEEGQEIFLAYLKFKQFMNINMLNLEQEIIFDKELLQNVGSFIVLGVSDDVTNLVDFGKEINKILCCSVIDIPKALPPINMDEIVNDANKEVDDSENKASREINEIETRNRSWIKWGVKGIVAVTKAYPLAVLGISSIGTPILLIGSQYLFKNFGGNLSFTRSITDFSSSGPTSMTTPDDFSPVGLSNTLARIIWQMFQGKK